MSDELIRRLVLELQPVVRLASPARRSMSFALPAVVVVVASAWLAGPRPDLWRVLTEPAYLAETALLLALFVGATIAAFSSSIPGLRLASAGWLIALAGGAWLVLIGMRGVAVPATVNPSSGLACVRRTLLLASIPAGLLFSMMRRSASVRAGLSGSLVLTSAGAVALLGTRLLCGKDDGAHALLWHALPLAALAVLGAVVGRAGLGARRVA